MRLLFFVLFFFIVSSSHPEWLCGQTASGGTTSIYGTFDPKRPPASLPTPTPVARPVRSGMTPQAYDSLQQSLQLRRPGYLGPPFFEQVDWTALGRSPSLVSPQALSLTPTVGFDGIGWTFYVPPSPDIAAGPEELLMTAHSVLARYSKTGTALGQVTLQQFLSDILPTICPAGAQFCNVFDPSIRYDSLHGRFLVLAFSEDATTEISHFVLSVSNGSTWDSGWKHWAIRAGLKAGVLTPYETDFPQMGYDNNCVYLTGNMLDVFRRNIVSSKILVLKKSNLYNLATTTLPYREFWDMQNEDGTVATTIRPAHLRGAPGTGVSPGILINASDVPGASTLTLWRIVNPTSDTPTISRTTLGGIWKYDYPAVFPSLGTLQRLTAGDSCVLKAVVRNGTLYTARNTGYLDTPTTVTYDRIDLAGNRVTTQGRLVGGNFFYPAFDVPASQGPGNTLGSTFITGSSTGKSGELTFIGIPGVKSGEGSYTTPNGRWGDFFGGTIDPVHGGLWTYGEYAKQTTSSVGLWGTWAAYFPWKTSSQFSDVPSSNPFSSYIDVVRLWSITTGCSSANYCPADTVTREQMAVFLIRSLIGDTFQSPATPYFTDVPATHPFFRYIQKLREIGITEGCATNRYCPGEAVTRGQMAAFLIRGKLANVHGEQFPFPTAAYFDDVPASAAFHKYVQKLRELGVTTGCGTRRFCPDDNITREQMAAFLTRAFLN